MEFLRVVVGVLGEDGRCALGGDVVEEMLGS